MFKRCNFVCGEQATRKEFNFECFFWEGVIVIWIVSSSGLSFVNKLLRKKLGGFDCSGSMGIPWGCCRSLRIRKSSKESSLEIVISAEGMKSIETTKMSKIYSSNSRWMQNKTKNVVIVVLPGRPLDPIKQSVLLPQIFLFLVSSIGLPNKSKHLRISMPGEKKFN